MGDCLKTQLKETVANNNIRKMDEFPVYFKNASNVLFGGKYVINYTDSPVTIRLGDGLTSVATSRAHVFKISGTGTLFIPQKKYISILQCETANGCDMKYSDLKYLSTLKTLSTTGNCSTMTLSELSTLVSLTIITSTDWTHLTGDIKDLYSPGWLLSVLNLSTAKSITGDFKYLGRFTNITNIRITSTPITGSIENFVAVQRGIGGRTTGSVTFQVGNLTNITFNGVKCTGSSTTDTITWTADSITYNGETISNSSVINSLN